jgi:hypothetical protein
MTQGRGAPRRLATSCPVRAVETSAHPGTPRPCAEGATIVPRRDAAIRSGPTDAAAYGTGCKKSRRR